MRCLSGGFVWDYYSGIARQPGRNGKALGLQKCRVEQFRLIAVTIVAEDRHDGMSRSQIFCQPNGAGNIDTRRATEAETFFFNEIEDQLNGFGIRDLIGEIRREPFPDLR